MKIIDKERWTSFILSEARYQLPEECRGGLCIDAGTNIGDFPMNFGNRFDKYVCFDVFDENIEEATNNTKHLNAEVHKLAAWDESDKEIDVMAYEPWDTKDINHFGNSGNLGCIELTGQQGEGWRKENTVGVTKTIDLDTIIKRWGKPNLLKVDVEGSEYKFLLGKDLRDVNWLVVELHGDTQQPLVEWIETTHRRVYEYDNVKIWKLK
jgi:FkbM family methyltransferase